MRGSRNDGKTLRRQEDNLRSAGFAPGQMHSRNFVVGKKKTKKKKEKI